jgi:hypothetical protein
LTAKSKSRFERFARLQAVSAGVIILGAALASSVSWAASCEALANLQTKDTVIDIAEAHAAGAYTPAGGSPLNSLPAFCRVHGVVSAVPGSQVGFEVWLPQDWNGKIEMVGNGGYSSAISFGSMADLVKRGYATVATDTGHKGDDPDFATGHSEAIIDWEFAPFTYRSKRPNPSSPPSMEKHRGMPISPAVRRAASRRLPRRSAIPGISTAFSPAIPATTERILTSASCGSSCPTIGRRTRPSFCPQKSFPSSPTP